MKEKYVNDTNVTYAYDYFGRLVEITFFGASVKYRYDLKGRIARQTVDGSPIDFAYTKYGQLAGKYLGGREKPDAAVEYEYSKSGQIIARTANGIRQTYEYDGRGQLLAVKEGDADVERYAYDKAGNMTKKMILVRGAGCLVSGAEDRKYRTTTFTFDGANQLVSSTTDGVTTKYAYDAAGRLVREGDRTYRYGYLDKVLSVTEGEQKYTYDYHVDGQLARADYGGNGAGCLVPGAGVETFEWDGLALIRRGDERFVNEPHIGGGNPVASSRGTTYFNDMLGTTVGVWEGRAPARPKSGRKYTPAALTAFGEDVSAPDTKHQAPSTFFTGKPEVAGLGHAFLFRNYRAGLAKWQTADPLGYPDGWNQLAYCGNGVLQAVDTYSLWTFQVGVFLFGGAVSSVTIQAGIALGLSWEDGFSWGWYYNGGIGSEVGASASAGIVFTTTNSRNVEELAGQALAVGISAGEGLVVGVDAIIPLNIAETGYWGYDFSIGFGGGTAVEGHAVYNFTGFFKVYE